MGTESVQQYWELIQLSPQLLPYCQQYIKTTEKVCCWQSCPACINYCSRPNISVLLGKTTTKQTLIWALISKILTQSQTLQYPFYESRRQFDSQLNGRPSVNCKPSRTYQYFQDLLSGFKVSHIPLTRGFHCTRINLFYYFCATDNMVAR